MEIIKTQQGEKTCLQVIGRLDTITANQLEAEFKKIGDEVKSIWLDLTQLEYITSVGIRILISANKMMNRQDGELVLQGLNSEVSEVLEITGVLEFFCVK